MTRHGPIYSPLRAAHDGSSKVHDGDPRQRPEKTMARLIAAFCLILGLALGTSARAVAQPVSEADARAARMVVSAQLDAFAKDDAKRAFSYAAPSIRAMFGTPERFLAMVRTGYPVVYRAAGVTFLIPLHVDGDLLQGVHLTDDAGALWLATYRLERQSDGTLRIAGCGVQPATGKMI
jgi:hypothetical protein